MPQFLPRILLAIGLVIVTSSSLFAQTERYELGRRLRSYEIQWQQADATARARSTRAMQNAVSNFFSLQFKMAARAIDGAYNKLESPQPPSELNQWIQSRKVTVQQRVVDAEQTHLTIGIGQFYDSPATPPQDASVQIVVREPNSGLEKFSERRAVGNLQSENGVLKLTCNWANGTLAPGDFQVDVNLIVKEDVRKIDTFVLSRVEKLEQREKALDELIEAVKETATPTGFQTLKHWRDLIRQSLKPERLEIDYPVNQLFSDFDTLRKCGGNSVRFLSEANRREFWLALRQERKIVTLRVRMPENRKAPRPLLFVFHGAGGSDNMFFETCGAGRCVELADQRNWITVSPDQGLMSRLALDCKQMVNILEEHFPIDRSSIFLMGHSMGAAQVLTQVKKHPELPKACVAIGGGRGQRNSEALAKTPWFIAAGQYDFGRRGAEALYKSLQSENASVEYKEYQDVEHMVIVQAALDDIFKFFDQAKSQDVK